MLTSFCIARYMPDYERKNPPLDKSEKKDGKTGNGKRISAQTVVGIVICVLLLPILIVNVTMLIKGFVNKDKVPDFGGYSPLIVLTDSMNPDTSAKFKASYPVELTFMEKVKKGLTAETEVIEIDRTDNERTLEVLIGDKKSVIKKIRGGDLIIVKTAKPEDVRIGDVISFFDPASSTGAVVTHRVVAIEYDEATDELVSFRTRGDRNLSADPDSVPKDNLVGIWTGTVFSGIGRVAMFIQSTPGLILCIAVPIILLLGAEYLFSRKAQNEKKTEQEKLMAELEELRAMKARNQNKEDGQSHEKADGDKPSDGSGDSKP